VRATLFRGDFVPDRRAGDGSPITNYVERLPSGAATRAYQVIPRQRRNLQPGFLLAMKHNAPYTAALPHFLAQTDLDVLAIIRHPVPTILSWRSLAGLGPGELPISRGRLPSAERLWPELHRRGRSADDLLSRQVQIYELICRRFLQHRDKICLLRYEEIVLDPELVERSLGRKAVQPLDVQDQNRSSAYDFSAVDEIQTCLRRYWSAARLLYPDLDAF
jgi:hypothetical protein